MWNILTNLGRAVVAIIAGIAMLILPAVIVSCGDDDSKGTESQFVVRNPQQSRPTPVTTPPPVTDTVTEATHEEIDVAAVPETPEEVTFDIAKAAFDERDYSRAMELFTRYTEQKSENPWGYYMLGLSAWQSDENDIAEKAFRHALELDSVHVKSKLNLSRVLLDTERPNEALVEVDEALAIGPKTGEMYRLQGRAFRLVGMKDEAVRSYRKSLEIDNEDVWSMNNLGLLYIEEGLFDKALPPLARAVELESGVAIFLNNLGMALEGTGHFRAAEEAYRSAISVDASYAHASDNLARIEGVLEDPGLEPIDLEVVAKSFVDEIEGWSQAEGESVDSEAVAVNEQPEADSGDTDKNDEGEEE